MQPVQVGSEHDHTGQLQARVGELEVQVARQQVLLSVLEQRVRRMEGSSPPPSSFEAVPPVLPRDFRAQCQPAEIEAEVSMSVDSPTASKENRAPQQPTPGSKRRAMAGPSPLRHSSSSIDRHSELPPPSTRRKTAQRSLAFSVAPAVESQGASRPLHSSSEIPGSIGTSMVDAILSSAAPMRLGEHRMQHLPANSTDAQPQARLRSQPTEEASMSHSSLHDPAVVRAAHTLSLWQQPIPEQQTATCLFDFEDGAPVHGSFLGSRGSESSHSGSLGRVLQPCSRVLTAASEDPAAPHKPSTVQPMEEVPTQY